MKLSKNWYPITNTSGLHKVYGLLQELNIGTPINPIIYIRFGYKILSAQDKETYYLLRELATLNFNKTNQSECSTNLDYLALALGTNETTQKHRVKKLEKFKLLKTLTNGAYLIYNTPHPDSTFVSTIVKFIRRKKLGELVRLYNACNNPISRIEYLTEINNLKSIGTSHPKLKTITDLTFTRPLPEEQEKEEKALDLLQSLAKLPKYSAS